jgi:hypothetical protein
MIHLILSLEWSSNLQKWIPDNPASGRDIMKRKIHKFCKLFPKYSSASLENRQQRQIATIVIVFVFAIIFSTLSGCSGTLKTSGVITSHEATAIWHTYEIQPSYNYYYAGPDTRPFYIIGVDDRYKLKSKLWKPVDLTPEMLKDWFNYYRPRVGGYNPLPYGAFIKGPNGERIGLWYSVVDWRLTGSAIFGENNEVTILMPTDEGRLKKDRNPYENEFSGSNDENDDHMPFWFSRYSEHAGQLRRYR